MPIDIKSLPPKYQAQALAKVMEQQRRRAAPAASAPLAQDQSQDQPPKRSKYGAIPTEREGIRFDSKKEARRYDELVAMLEARVICDLRLQVEYTLQGAYTTPDGKRVRAIRYLADFTYTRTADGAQVVEDVKSRPTATPTYKMKKKMMLDRFGIEIKEV